MALSDFTPEYNESDLHRDVTRPQLKKGTFLFRVTKASQKVNEKGNMVISTFIAPVAEDGTVRSPGANFTLVGPFRTPPGMLAESGLPADAQKDGAPKTTFLIQKYAQARRNPKFIHEIGALQPIKRVGSKWVVVDGKGQPTGEAIEAKEDREVKAMAIADQARKFYQAVWKDVSLLVGDEFYGSVEWKEGSEYPNINVCDSQDPADLDLVDMNESIVRE